MNQEDLDYAKRRDFLLSFIKKQNDAELCRIESDDKKYFGKAFKAKKYGENLKTYAPKRYKK